MTHWAVGYIGLPWVSGGASIDDGFDCWGFFKYIQLKHYDRKLPEIELNKSNFSKAARDGGFDRWSEVNKPKDGDAVLMRVAKYPNHVGTWIKNGEDIGILHSVENIGVLFSTVYQLQLTGWKIIKYYRYNG